MEGLLQDLRFAIRMLVKNPGFTIVSVLTLMLGIGANTAIFSVVNEVLLEPLPFENPGQLVMVFERRVEQNAHRLPVSPPNFVDWRDQNTVLQTMAAYYWKRFNLSSSDMAEALTGIRVTPELFSLLGARPELGRTLFSEDGTLGDDRVVLLSHALWQRLFGGDSRVVGQNVSLDGNTHTVVGVMPPGFDFPSGTEIWAPLDPDRSRSSRGSNYLTVLARLRPEVDVPEAQAGMDVIADRLEQEYPDSNEGLGVNIVSLREVLVGDSRKALLLLFGAVGFVLLIACANVANLLLARGTVRKAEFAVRVALGAGRARLIRQLLSESVLLAMLGGGLGLMLARWAVDALPAVLPDGIPRLEPAGIHASVLGFTVALSFLTGLVFGLPPAFQACSRVELHESLKEGGRTSIAPGRHRLRSTLVVAQIALALALLACAGLLIRSFWLLTGVDPGFDASNVLTMRISLPPSKHAEPRQQATFYRQACESIGRLPGVRHVGATTTLPFSGTDLSSVFSVVGRPEPSTREKPAVVFHSITPDYFRAMGIPLLRGRLFTERDTKQTPGVTIINETMARRFWPGADPMGQSLVIGLEQNDDQPESFEIVGIVGDVLQSRLDAEFQPEIFVPYSQQTWSFMTFAVRTSGEPLSLVDAIRGQILALDKEQPVYNVRTMKQLLASSTAQSSSTMLLLNLFALLALVLAAVGIYGVISSVVSGRTHEIGLRMALGAQRSDILWMVLGYGMRLIMAGVGIGAAAALGLAQLMKGLLYGVSATDTMTLVTTPLVLMMVALLACQIPARRATRVDPAVSLREE